MQIGKGLGGKVGRKELCCSEGGKHNIYLFCPPTWDKFVGELPNSLFLSFKSGLGAGVGWGFPGEYLNHEKPTKERFFWRFAPASS